MHAPLHVFARGRCPRVRTTRRGWAYPILLIFELLVSSTKVSGPSVSRQSVNLGATAGGSACRHGVARGISGTDAVARFKSLASLVPQSLQLRSRSAGCTPTAGAD